MPYRAPYPALGSYRPYHVSAATTTPQAAGEDLQLALDSVRFRLLAAAAAANEAARAAEQAADRMERAATAVAEVERLIRLAGSTLS